MLSLVFASNNANKIREIQLLVPNSIKIVSLEDIGCKDEIPETASTIEGNAILKANYITQKYNLPCFADDSGLEIEALNGEPGVFSARYAGEPKNDDYNIKKVLQNLEGINNRNANFKTVICLNLNNSQHLFTGIVNGKITNQKLGNNGFGYDPIFVPDGFFKTFAQMSAQEKSAISHRAIAVTKMIEFLKNVL